jgi:ribose transport system permease protein
MAIARTLALRIGGLNGIGVALARVHPLVMTLGTGLIATGGLLVYLRYASPPERRSPTC